MSTPLVEIRHVRKAFGPVVALDNVDFAVQPGEIRGLLGENGAGKSTLMKILYGLYAPDGGEILVDGNPVAINSPADSIRLGIGMVHQSSTLVNGFTAVENILMGTTGDALRLPLSQAAGHIRRLSEQYGLDFPIGTRASELSAGVKQKIEIIRALYRGAKTLILDEPTTSLVESEFEQLLKSLKVLVDSGVTVIFITHKIREVMAACHTVTVMRKGSVQASLEREEMSKERLVKAMFIERDIDVTESALPKVRLGEAHRSERPVLRIESVSTRSTDTHQGLREVTLEVFGGEILGVAAVSGNGEKELAETVVNPGRITSGKIFVGDESLAEDATLDVFARGAAYTPEDRTREAILPDGSLVENVLLGHQGEARFLSQRHFVNWPAVREATLGTIADYNVYTPGPDLSIRRLSGGNIQKTIMGRAFISSPRLLVTHNPTAGLDISTVEFIFERLEKTRREGGAILWVNEDLDELMILADRIAVLHRGSIVAVFEREEFDKYQIGLYMTGGAAGE